MRHDIFVKDFEGYKPNPTIREVANRKIKEIDNYRDSEDEDLYVSGLPGDDTSQHPLMKELNPYVSKLPSSLKAQLAEEDLDDNEKQKILEALEIIESLEGVQFFR